MKNLLTTIFMAAVCFGLGTMNAEAETVVLFDDTFDSFPCGCPGTQFPDNAEFEGDWVLGNASELGVFGVSDTGPPLSPQGGTYLRGWNTGGYSEIDGDFDVEASDSGIGNMLAFDGSFVRRDTLRLSFLLYLPESGQNRFRLMFKDKPGGTPPANEFLAIRTLGNDGGDGNGGDIDWSENGWQPTGVKYHRNTWERWILEWDLNNHEVFLSVGGSELVSIGNNWSGRTAIESGAVSRFVIGATGSADDGSSAWAIDDVLLTSIIPDPPCADTLAVTQAELATANASNTALQSELDTANASNTALQSELDTANAALETANNELAGLANCAADLAACQADCANCSDLETDIIDAVCGVLGTKPATSTQGFIDAVTALATSVLNNADICDTDAQNCLQTILGNL